MSLRSDTSAVGSLPRRRGRVGVGAAARTIGFLLILALTTASAVPAAAAEEIDIAAAETHRVALQETAELRLIVAIAEIVDAELAQVFAALEHETVPVPALRLVVRVHVRIAPPIRRRRLPKRVVAIALDNIPALVQQRDHIALFVLLVEQEAQAGIPTPNDLVRFRSVKIRQLSRFVD